MHVVQAVGLAYHSGPARGPFLITVPEVNIVAPRWTLLDKNSLVVSISEQTNIMKKKSLGNFYAVFMRNDLDLR